MTQENKRNLSVIISAVIFGLIGGVFGEIFARAYVIENIYKIPLSNEMNFSDGKLNSGITINPKTVVVEQNARVADAANSAKGNLVGIYKKINTASLIKNKTFDLENFYKLGAEAGEGYIVTSDGWIITNFKPNILDYVAITQDKKIYNIDKVISDPLTPFFFIHANAEDLSVKGFADRSEIKNGQLVIAVNRQGEVELNSIVNANDRGDNFIFSSDELNGRIVLAEKLDEKFNNSFLFNLSGEIIGPLGTDGLIKPISYFNSAVIGLIKNKEIKRPVLGINYINLSLLAAPSSEYNIKNYNKGALIYRNSAGISVVKNGPADKAGLKEGDIIISVDNIEINEDNDLIDVIQGFSAGSSIEFSYLRDGKEEEAVVVLGEKKSEVKK